MTFLAPAQGSSERLSVDGTLIQTGCSKATSRPGRAYDAASFVAGLRALNASPHVAQNLAGRRSRIDRRTVRHTGYLASQRARKRIEEAFAWVETIAGQDQTRFRDTRRAGWAFTLAAAVYNLIRLPNCWRHHHEPPRRRRIARFLHRSRDHPMPAEIRLIAPDEAAPPPNSSTTC